MNFEKYLLEVFLNFKLLYNRIPTNNILPNQLNHKIKEFHFPIIQNIFLITLLLNLVNFELHEFK
jgi:hypothetical protein